MTSASMRGRLTELIAPVVAGAGYDLEDVVVTPAGKRRLLRVVVDRDGGVSLDDVAELSRATSEALDASDAMGATPYVLEVTSPGVDRPLTEPRHWRRAVGRLVAASLRDGGRVTGRVVSATGEGVLLDDGGAQVMLGYETLSRGVVQVEFNRAGTAHGGPAGDDEEEAPA
ncbi:MAG: ribosome maturation factor RimP [Frankiaceae bacterium]